MNKKEAITALQNFGKTVKEEDIDKILVDIMGEAASLLMDSVRTSGGKVDTATSSQILNSLKIAEAKLDGRLKRAKSVRSILEKGAQAAFSIALSIVFDEMEEA